MKKQIYIILTICIIIAICIVSCPDKSAHKEAVMQSAKREINSDMDAESEYAGLQLLGSTLEAGLLGWVLDNTLTIDNYFVCSVGTISFQGKSKVVSFGIMNHVFVLQNKDN